MRALLLALSLLACGPARNVVHTLTPTAPRDEGVACPAVAWRCTAGVPERCQASDGRARWYPMHPLTPAGSPAACRARCVVDGDPAVAHCAPEASP